MEFNFELLSVYLRASVLR